MHFTPLRRAFVHDFFARELFRFLGFQSRTTLVLCPARSLPLFLAVPFANSTKLHRTAASEQFPFNAAICDSFSLRFDFAVVAGP